MKSKRTSLALGLALLLAGFGGLATLAYAAGTALSISFSPASIVCGGTSGASVTFYYTVTSSGAADAAMVTESINGTQVNSYTILSGNVNNGGGWTFPSSGPLKTYSGTYQASLGNGEYTFTVCTTQNGANGNQDKSACNSQTVTINCISDPPLTCANTGPFGEVPHNTNLCSASGTIQVQFRGNFGETAHLTIRDSSGTTYVDTDVTRAGDSCNYHFNWNPRPANSTSNPGTGNGGAGPYIFTVTGNSQAPLIWSANLACE